MNKPGNVLSSIFAVIAIAVIGIGCNQSADNAPPVANTPTANSAPSNSTATTTAAPTKDISGSYTVSGQNEGGAGNYTGDLTVAKRDQVYQFSWTSGGRKYDGVGVQSANSVGVAFTEGTDGKGCGVILYTVKPNGDLDGKFGYWGVNEAQTETATRTSGTGIEGSYNVKGSNPDGTSYDGTLDVTKKGAGYSFVWNAGSTSTGFGIRGADMVAVGFGGSKCGFVGYDIQPDGSLSGKWGSPGSTSVGTEVAKKK